VNYAKLLEMNSFFTLHSFLEVDKTQDLPSKFWQTLGYALSKKTMDGVYDVLLLYRVRDYSAPVFYCPMDRLMWVIVCFTFGVSKPVNMGHLLGPWLKSFSKQRNLVLIGLAALC
jgi:hypothetical protein